MPAPIRVYALSTCIHCKRAKEFLDQCGAEYTPVHLDWMTGQERTDALTEMKQYNPAQSFPTILIGDSVIVGFKKEEIEKALGIDPAQAKEPSAS
ncbi:glutaredoxin family protein [Desulfonatronum lacustre]|uniref:glutaredoxin family protein n=1 Tax=Desulfonatronum lacustre TaxID=66849 RepID=UPI0004BCA11F|nr:glutaredoxin family protein [Desulfonatronum lacustre]SMP77807.1 Glutaredoxin [Desulfonatronum zhilinae]